MKRFIRVAAPYLRRERGAFVWGFLAILLTNLFGVFQPKLLERAIDTLNVDSPVYDDVVFYAVLLVAAGLLQGIFRFLMRRTIIYASWRMVYEMRKDLFDHLQRLDLGFYQEMRTGDIMSRATEDLNAVRSVMGPAIMYTFNTSVAAVMVLTMMIQISPQLTGIVLIPLVLTAAAVKLVSDRLAPLYRAVQDHQANVGARLQDNLSGIRVVKTYTMEEREIGAFQEMNAEYIDKNMKTAYIEGLMRPLSMTLLGSGTVIILWIGGQSVITGTMSLGQLIAFDVYLIMLAWPAISVGWVMSLVQRGLSAMDRIQEIMEREPRISNPDETSTPEIRGEVTFDHVSFSYTEGTPVLNDVSLKVGPGETLGILGPVGSGKSTLVNLVPRLFDVQQGAVLIDGHDVRSYDLGHLRRSIGFVPQENFLFSVSIAENIAFGESEIDPGRLEWASRASRLEKDLEDLPKGLDTLLGERGINLSGGQKQRAAIARAIFIDPKILILDDCLSAVDTNTEAEILHYLRQVREGRTTLIISHRVSSIRDADQIVVFRDGSIVEQGNHETLIDHPGYYRDLYERQLLEEEINTLED